MTGVIDNIVGIACLPIGVLLFLNAIGATGLSSLFGVKIMLLGALALLAIQAANLVATHIHGEWIVLSYVVHILCTLPALLYFLSLAVTLPAALVANLPMMLACFIIVEGLYSFFF